MRTHTLVLIALALLAAPALPAADTTVWRIGKFDHASVEFSEIYEQPRRAF